MRDEKQTHFCEYSLARATYALPVFFLDAGEGTVAKSLSSFLFMRWCRSAKGIQCECLDEALTPFSQVLTILPGVRYLNLGGA